MFVSVCAHWGEQEAAAGMKMMSFPSAEVQMDSVRNEKRGGSVSGSVLDGCGGEATGL